MELALIVSLVVLTVVAVVGVLGYVIDRGAGRLER
jgi:preprotein translocase subunit SecE